MEKVDKKVSGQFDILINPKLKEKVQYKMCKSTSVIITLLILFLILFGYDLYNSYNNDIKVNQRDMNLQKVNDILQEFPEKIRLYFNHFRNTFSKNENDNSDLYATDPNSNTYLDSIDRFKRDASIIPNEDNVRIKINGKRQANPGNFRTCYQYREECLKMMDSMSSNLKAAEKALTNINNLIQRIKPVDPRTEGLLMCLQCHQFEQNNMISYQNNPNPTNLNAYSNSNPYNNPPYYNNLNGYNNPIPNNNQNPYSVQKSYDGSNVYKNLYFNNQPNVYKPNSNNNPIPYNIPNYNNPNIFNYNPNAFKTLGPANQNFYNIPDPSNNPKLNNNFNSNFNDDNNLKINNDSTKNDDLSVKFTNKTKFLSQSDIQTIILSSKTNTSKIKDGKKITEVIRNQTIVEKSLSTERPLALTTEKSEPTRFTLPIEFSRSETRADVSSGLKVSERMSTRDTKDRTIIKQNSSEVDEVTEDPSILKTLQRSSMESIINNQAQFQGPTIPSAESITASDLAGPNNKISPFLCYWPSVCFFRQNSGQQVQASPMFTSESAIVHSFQSAPGSYVWNTANQGPSSDDRFYSFDPYPRSFGPTGPGGILPDRNSFNQPVQCSHIPYMMQDNYGYRAANNRDNHRDNPLTELKNPGTMECPKNYTKCFDGKKCILDRNWCDGIVDCSDSSDEIHCSCKDRISPNKHCDGYFDCPRGEDELGCFGCGNDSFSCLDWTKRNFKGNCVSLSERCDGERQCRNGRDEKDCHLLTESYIDNDDISTIGHSSGYLFKNWHGKWYPSCSLTEAWADEACRGEIGSLTGIPVIKKEPVLPRYRLGPYISLTESGNIELTPECDDQAVFVKCPIIPCGTSLVDQYYEFLPFEDIMVASPHLIEATSEPAIPLAATMSDPEAFEDLSSFGRVSGDSRIVGGRASQPQAWPFLVAIHRDGFFHCGGVIVDDQWILTAAHCVESHHTHYYQIFAGLLRRFSFSPMAQIRQAKFVIPHPEYNSHVMRNDLALIKLNEPLMLNRWIRATCLPIPAWGTIPAVNETCTTIGWGATIENGPDPDHLREAKVPIVAKCTDKHDRSSGIVCAGWNEGGKDACQGDSGGPLMCQVPDSNRWYVAGIISHGEGCARPNKTGAYTRVSYYYPWITSTLTLNHDPFGPKPLTSCPGFKCHGETGKCLPLKRRCDKTVDCLNAEDETHCYYSDIHVNQITKVPVKKTNEHTSDEVVEEVIVKNYNSPKSAEKPIDTENYYGTETSIYRDETNFNDQNETTFNGDTVTQMNEEVTDEIRDVVNEITESSSSRYDDDDDNNAGEINARTHQNDETIEASVSVWNLPENVDTFICANITQSISRPLRCDKKIDCQDGTDELHCRCTDILYIKHPLSICDGRIDCADKSDELDCSDERNKKDTYLCVRSAAIIPAEKRCNGAQDCQLHDDEKDCYALTNGDRIELDLEGSTTLKKNGIVSVNRNNTWSIKCFNNIEKNLEETADEYCGIVGFHNHEFASLHYVDEKILEAYTNLGSNSITFNRDEVIKNISERSPGAVMCYALYVECEMNFKRPVYDYLYKSNITNNETYLLPWEPAIFVDGKYHCPALLLNTKWAMTSTRCTNNINLDKNITAIVAGLSIPHQYVDGPHQQIRMVDHIMNLDQFHTSLLHFDELPTTRYIKPIFINRRPLPAEGEHCYATGVDNNLAKNSAGFDAVVEDCPSCKRCFKNSLKNFCPKNGTTHNWSGFISCYNSRGWYPAAVFHEKDIVCGFTDPQALIGIDEMYPHLVAIMDKNYFKPPPSAKCDDDGMKCAEGKCVPLEKLCDGIQDCRDGSDENNDNCLRKQDYCNKLTGDKPNDLCGCSIHQLTCGNGSCIPKNMFCDGSNDCGDGSDEPLGCSCRDYLHLTSPHRLCNKVRDCFDKSDEDQELCGCSNEHFDCSNGTMSDGEKLCVPHDFVCDGQKDCPQGEDESSCRAVKSIDNKAHEGRVLKRQLGVWFDECFPHPIISDKQALKICKSMGYSSGVLLDEQSRKAYGPPQTISEALYYSLNLNGMAIIVLKDDVPSATLTSQHDDCNRAFVRCTL